MKLHERQETVVADLRAKLRHLRQDATTKEKKLELAHRTIERLSVDKHGLQAGDAAKKTYIRQLESRVTGMKSTSELELMCGQLQAEIQSLRSQLQISKEKAIAAEEVAAKHQAETQFLRRGIQLAAEQLARSSGTDISASMLMAVAQGQHEAVELSSQLAETQGQVDEMAGALTAARTHLQAQHDALLQWQQWETTQSQQAEEREEALRSANEVSKRFLKQVEVLQTAVNEARRERDTARHYYELEKTARQDSEEKTRGLGIALRQSEHNEITLRAEIQRLVIAGNALSGAAAVVAPEPPSLRTAPPTRPSTATAAAVVGRTSLPPTRPQSGAAAPDAKFSPAATTTTRYFLDVSIAALERELAQMAAHTGLAPRSSSPQKEKNQKPGTSTWHTNPLAEEAEAAPSASAHSLNESAAWRLLEHGFDQQRAEDRRMNALWQPENEILEAEPTTYTYTDNEEEQEQEESSAAAISLAAAPSSSVNMDAHSTHHHHPAATTTTAALRVQVHNDGDANGIGASPGISSNNGPTTSVSLAQPRGPLPSPDLGQFSARASADWLNGSIGDGFKQLEEDIKNSKSGNGVRGLTVHAYAGVLPSQSTQPPPAAVEERQVEAEKPPPARPTLFDLARMELEY